MSEYKVGDVVYALGSGVVELVQRYDSRGRHTTDTQQARGYWGGCIRYGDGSEGFRCVEDSDIQWRCMSGEGDPLHHLFGAPEPTYQTPHYFVD